MALPRLRPSRGTPGDAPDAPAPPDQSRDYRGIIALTVVLVALFLGKDAILARMADNDAARAWMIVFVAITVQALPFLVLGVVLSAVISVFVPADALRRCIPSRPALAVPVAGVSGMALPGCECASVPVSGSLMARGVAPAVALTFQLAAPAINPVVLVSTAVAFGGRADVVFARFLASFLTAAVVGWIWLKLGRDDLLKVRERHLEGTTKPQALAQEVGHDVLHAGGFLVLGAAVAACVNILVPRAWLDALAGNWLIAALALALFAVIVAMCSEADAFVAASLTAFPLSARLVFLVVGPVIDVKLIAMQVATFGRSFAVRFAPLSFAVAVVCGLVVGAVVL